MINMLFKILTTFAFGFLIGIIILRLASPGSIVHPDLPKYRVRAHNQGKNPAIIKLGNDKGGFCTAFVIDNNYAMTAAHCIQSGMSLTQNIQILLPNGLSTGVLANGVGTSDRIDVGLLYGNFSNFNSLPVDFYSLNYYNPPYQLYSACGFPFLQNTLTCSDFIPVSNYGFSIRGVGHLIPGMSGGPVLKDNIVIGVNSAMFEGGALVAPVTGSLGMFRIE